MLQVERLADEEYQHIVDTMPILCVDLVLSDRNCKYLLVKRNNDPLKGKWWVPGGRVFKDESLEEAAVRKAREELSLEITKPKLWGYHEYLLGEIHAVSFVFTIVVGDFAKIILDNQSSEWKLSEDLPDGFDIMPFLEF